LHRLPVPNIMPRNNALAFMFGAPWLLDLRESTRSPAQSRGPLPQPSLDRLTERMRTAWSAVVKHLGMETARDIIEAWFRINPRDATPDQTDPKPRGYVTVKMIRDLPGQARLSGATSYSYMASSELSRKSPIKHPRGYKSLSGPENALTGIRATEIQNTVIQQPQSRTQREHRRRSARQKVDMTGQRRGAARDRDRKPELRGCRSEVGRRRRSDGTQTRATADAVRITVPTRPTGSSALQVGVHRRRRVGRAGA
jgi:hypothetical protein